VFSHSGLVCGLTKTLLVNTTPLRWRRASRA
jgi:hypothetical protein